MRKVSEDKMVAVLDRAEMRLLDPATRMLWIDMARFANNQAQWSVAYDASSWMRALFWSEGVGKLEERLLSLEKAGRLVITTRQKDGSKLFALILI